MGKTARVAAPADRGDLPRPFRVGVTHAAWRTVDATEAALAAACVPLRRPLPSDDDDISGRWIEAVRNLCHHRGWLRGPGISDFARAVAEGVKVKVRRRLYSADDGAILFRNEWV